MKKAVFAIFLAVVTVLVCACSKPEPVGLARLPQKGEDGAYIGFNDIPDGYTADDALADGCLLIDITQKPNEYGVNVADTRRTGGYEYWLAFKSAAEANIDAFLRIAYFIDGVGYYHDLYHTNGKYFMYELNEYGISGGKEFKYLRRLDGIVGPQRKEDCYYVLTDSLELTYRDIEWSYLSSSTETVTKIPFKWLSFMIYFE